MTKLKWGMIGGGEGSQIGPAHRLGSGLDGLFEFTAGALDHRPDAGREFAQRLGLHADRSYGDWQEMLKGERDREDRVDLVTVATPNSTHYEITKAFLEAGFHVLCEKPMTMTVEEGEDIVNTANSTGSLCAVNYGYTGYSLVRHMRAMVTRGDLGKIRLVNAEFAHGHHADAADADNPRVRWRYDPEQAGVSAQFADCGIHALHMASFVTGQEVTTLSADIVSCIASRKLEDDAMVNFRMDVNMVWLYRCSEKKAGYAGLRNNQTNFIGCRLTNDCKLSSEGNPIYRQKPIALLGLPLVMLKVCHWPLPISIKILQRPLTQKKKIAKWILQLIFIHVRPMA